MLAGLPATTRTIDVHGVSTAVLEAGGDGPGLLLLHGGIECGGAMWAPVLARLARHCRVVVPDVPGLGESAPVPDLDVTAFGEWLTGVTELTEPRGSDSRCPLAHRHSHGPARRQRLSRNGTTRRVWRTGRRPVPHAASSPIRGHPARDPPQCSQRRAFRSLRPSRSRRDARTRPRVVRRLRRVHAVPRPRARHQEDDAPAHREQRPGPSRRPSSTASTFPPPCCGDATTGWSRSRSAKPPHHAMAGLCTSSTAQPTPRTSNNPRRSRRRSPRLSVS